jgi:hypothetical protein
MRGAGSIGRQKKGRRRARIIMIRTDKKAVIARPLTGRSRSHQARDLAPAVSQRADVFVGLITKQNCDARGLLDRRDLAATAAYVEKQRDRWTPLVKAMGIRIE